MLRPSARAREWWGVLRPPARERERGECCARLRSVSAEGRSQERSEQDKGDEEGQEGWDKGREMRG